MQGPAKVGLARGWLMEYMNVSHGTDSNLNMSPKRSHGVLECDIVMLQNDMLMIL